MPGNHPLGDERQTSDAIWERGLIRGLIRGVGVRERHESKESRPALPLTTGRVYPRWAKRECRFLRFLARVRARARASS
jgi:hypothetical protein